ncbi:MAG: NAD+ synthase, partial [Gammaproteobacteria bacterium]
MPTVTETNPRPVSHGPRVALAQLNLWVGDLQGNASRVIAAAGEARDRLDADLVVFPELTLTGYPPEDLLLRPGFHDRVATALERVVAEVRGIAALVGFPHCQNGAVYNACALIRDGKIVARYCKQNLPNYGVFDEKRYFVEGDTPCVVDVAGVPMGLTICEDIWVPGPAAQAAAAGAKVILNINASPFHLGKGDERERLLAERSRETGLPVIYVYLVGGQDELV